jgi:hypothetical protein
MACKLGNDVEGSCHDLLKALYQNGGYEETYGTPQDIQNSGQESKRDLQNTKQNDQTIQS